MSHLLGDWTRDLTHAARNLLRAPEFTVVTVATLALAIGANTAIFSAVDTVLLAPLPFEEPDRLVDIKGTAQGGMVALVGVGLGLVAALFVTRLLDSMLFGVGAVDPLTFALTAAVMLAVGIRRRGGRPDGAGPVLAAHLSRLPTPCFCIDFA